MNGEASFYSQGVHSSPSPPRSGGEGRGEVVLQGSGGEALIFHPEIYFGNHSNKSKRREQSNGFSNKSLFSLLPSIQFV
jgi:hypothetical protein